MSSAELQPHELMQLVADFFEAHKIPYRVVGSLASMAYGEPRFTNDVDIVAELKPEHVALLCAAFPAPSFEGGRDRSTRHRVHALGGQPNQAAHQRRRILGLVQLTRRRAAEQADLLSIERWRERQASA